MAPLAVVLFLSAALIFWLEPLVARQLLPQLGGSPAVWTTCVLFYQLALLTGYALAHALVRAVPLRAQVLAFVSLLVVAGLALPPQASAPDTSTGRLELLLLAGLAASVGPAFLALGMTSPLLQAWLAQRGDADPYRLYAASNAGSLLGLLAYPLLLEPGLGIVRQGWAWSAGFATLVALALPCAAVAWRAGGPRLRALDPGPRPTAAARALWLVLAAIPSSLVLGVTAHVSTDVAAVPLLWVVPMAIYLTTFALAFAPGERLPWRAASRWLPLAVVTWLISWIMEATDPAALVVALDLALLCVAAAACHGRLAALRPPPGRLTEYYLYLGLGGALGGAFNALLAPVLFSSLAELPFAAVVACLLVPARGQSALQGAWRRNVALGLLPGAAAFGLALAPGVPAEGPARRAATIGLPALLCYTLSAHPLRFGIGVAGVLLASLRDESLHGTQLAGRRSFFGVHRVIRSDAGAGKPMHALRHGTTEHGRQRVAEATGLPTDARTPLAYYHRRGPLGDLFDRPDRFARVGVVGLGAGSLAAFAEAGSRMVFFEIDPVVRDLALDPRYFGYVAAARERGADVEIVLGDARHSLSGGDERFDLLVLDAFGSDAIPVHLLTREALAQTIGRLRPGALLAVHVSSRSVDLAPVVSRLAGALGVAAVIRRDLDVPPGESARTGRWPSIWIAMAPGEASLGRLRDAGWEPLTSAPDAPLWTDDYTPLLRALRWRGASGAE